MIGSHLPHFTGTRSGFNNKAKSYRDQVIKSIAKHLPFDDYKEGSVTEQTTARDGQNSLRGPNTELSTARRDGSPEAGSSLGKKLTKAQKEVLPQMRRIEKLKLALL